MSIKHSCYEQNEIKTVDCDFYRSENAFLQYSEKPEGQTPDESKQRRLKVTHLGLNLMIIIFY